MTCFRRTERRTERDRQTDRQRNRRTTSTSRHWIQTTTTFCLINVSGRSTYSFVHCRWQSISCRSRSSMEQSSIARYCCPFSLSIFCLLLSS